MIVVKIYMGFGSQVRRCSIQREEGSLVRLMVSTTSGSAACTSLAPAGKLSAANRE